MSAQDFTASAAAARGIAGNLRQMIAVLERERQALATLDPDGLIEAANEKQELCEALMPVGPDAIDPETRSLAETAQKLNEVNRRVRNLLAANVATRIDALTGSRRSARSAALARA